jgi:hypothetical protein
VVTGVKDGLAAAGLGAKDLPRMKGSAPQKLTLAELLWKRTTVSQEWIAQKLAMRSAANVSQQLRQFDVPVNQHVVGDFRGAAPAASFDAARCDVVFPENAAAFNDAPACRFEGGVDVFGAGFCFVHVSPSVIGWKNT